MVRICITGDIRSAELLNDELNCTPRSLDQFPPDFFTEEQRKAGGVIVHILICLYIFGALAIVCDDYFVASLEVICDVLGLQPDVAGATFMAAGSSAPELFTSCIGVFLAKSDVGVGTIVGSAVFNILFIVGICGIGAGMIVYLTWWPLFRDASFYTLTVIALIIVIYDETVHWYEALVFLIMYIIYVVIMHFNPRLGDFWMDKVAYWQRSYENSRKQQDQENKDIENQPLLRNREVRSQSLNHSDGGPTIESGPEEHQQSFIRSNTSLHRSLSKQKVSEEEDEYESPWTFPDSCSKRLFWITMLPATLLFFLTIPDCRRPGCWRKTFMLTFISSIIWLAILSYFMVWMVTIIGDTSGIPDTVMGLTLLAAGTSIPDALASVFVARDGYGDMAVSNTIGSNVFDILIGLGLPWLIQTGFISPNDTVHINSEGLTFSAITLLATIVILFAIILLNKWRLNKTVGVILLFVYAIFVVLACLYELNVFGYLNPPPCPRN